MRALLAADASYAGQREGRRLRKWTAAARRSVTEHVDLGESA